MRRFPVQSYQDDQDDEDDVFQPNWWDSGDSDIPQNEDTPSDTANEANVPDTQPLRRSSRYFTRPERYVETCITLLNYL